MVAKRAVAIFLRDRYRRRFVSELFRNEITPKNILMIGSTGVGKTKIARCLVKLDGAPFIKIEATKFTEISYVGCDVESMIRDLVDIAINLIKEEKISKVSSKATCLVEEKILDIVLSEQSDFSVLSDVKSDEIKSVLRRKLRSGELNHRDIEVDVAQQKSGFDFMSVLGMEALQISLIIYQIHYLLIKKK